MSPAADPSPWDQNLGQFIEDIATKRPAPGGVAVAAVSAVTALALLVKVMSVSGAQQERIKLARQWMGQLRESVERDVVAVQNYIARRDAKALKEAIDVPLEAARITTQGVELCLKVARAVTGLVSADVGVAATVLTSATRGMLACVDANMRESSSDFAPSLLEERSHLEKRAVHAREQVFEELQ